MHIRKIYGPPGTGKTTKLLNEVKQDIKELDITLKDIMYVSTTNTAIEEVRGRIGITKNNVGKYFKTLHGIALSHLLTFKKDVQLYNAAKNTLKLYNFVETAKIKFCREIKVRYEPEAVSSNAPANQAFEAWSYVIAKYYHCFEDVDRCFSAFQRLYKDLPWLVRIIRRWLEYKKQMNYIDYEDLLIYLYHNPPYALTPVVKFDEAQDFADLEWEILRRTYIDVPPYTPLPRRITIAGDDDQTILSFRGASAEKFLDFPTDEEIVLEKSWRVKENILKFANSIIKHVEKRKSKKVEPVAEGGIVAYRSFANIYQLTDFAAKIANKYSDKTVFLLFYTNSMVHEAEIELYRLKQPFRRLKGESAWEKEVLTAWNIAAKLKSNKQLTYDEFKFLLRHMRAHLISKGEKENMLSSFKQCGTPIQFYTLTKLYSIQQLLDSKTFNFARTLDIIKTARYTIKPAQVNLYVDTIHASKGREANIVIVANAINRKALYENSIDDLRRVFYVAATRARDVCVVANIATHTQFLRKEVVAYATT
ncbi:hypothetical protein Asulf_01182 [Archaeoglobus sulfaticallidus PM70-1]|uniref:UvrD-like helicase ATP-binding domain-containing protein n=1 Tax=Archaeoglobus sulfaticallidus PM70-1 TaxID=387631 RepID=N0BKX5_9EURY|nr:ATP-dependent helicase [Archaeoglobus sulfaticallidus]AGK61181.1 hypothetical protein Asulf_01182 [Archaeoglobus sulfaticallidus PM70-1]